MVGDGVWHDICNEVFFPPSRREWRQGPYVQAFVGYLMFELFVLPSFFQHLTVTFRHNRAISKPPIHYHAGCAFCSHCLGNFAGDLALGELHNEYNDTVYVMPSKVLTRRALCLFLFCYFFLGCRELYCAPTQTFFLHSFILRALCCTTCVVLVLLRMQV